MTETLDAMELIRRGQAAARVGRREEARRLLRQAVELDPGNVGAWLDLASVEEDRAKKRACFERALALDPGSADARLGLEMLEEDEEPANLDMVIAEASRQLDAAVGPAPAGQVPPDDGVLYCVNHPKVETMLRCNRCGEPICSRCAVLTPVGYRCKQCVRGQQAVFYTGGTVDYVISGVLALVLGGVAAYLMGMLGGWFFALILGPALGVGIAEAVRFAVQRRQSRHLWAVVLGGMVISGLAVFLFLGLWAAIGIGIYLVTGGGTAVARLR
ncbi:MAG: tetratricopeptide repeat protein [Anaerolineae bacterium]|nr:tetratricopeptide repeat protein [Anaerolineae bacterium]